MKIRETSLCSNADIIQSSILTNASYDITRIEMQILIILVAAAQMDVRESIAKRVDYGEDYKRPAYTQDIQVAFSLNDFPVDMSGHELELKRAAESLVKKTITTKTDTGWIVQPLLTKVEYIKPERKVIMNVSPEIWSQIMNINLGYSEYELFTALNLKSLYSVRFYMMASSNLGTRELTFDELKKQFNLERSYQDNNNFLRRVVYPASKELDEKAPVSFTAVPFKKPGAKEFSGITFTPRKISRSRDANLEHKKLTHGRVQIGMALESSEIEWLLRDDKLSFTHEELSRNFETFNVAKKKYGGGLLDIMYSIYEEMLRRGKGGQKGYFIKSLKNNSSTAEQTGNLF